MTFSTRLFPEGMNCIGTMSSLKHLELENLIQLGDSHLRNMHNLNKLTHLRMKGLFSLFRLHTKRFAVMRDLRTISIERSSVMFIEPGMFRARMPNVENM